jgi:hypothetical protein
MLASNMNNQSPSSSVLPSASGSPVTGAVNAQSSAATPTGPSSVNSLQNYVVSSPSPNSNFNSNSLLLLSPSSTSSNHSNNPNSSNSHPNDPNAPKPPLTGYQHYFKLRQSELRIQDSKLKFGDIVKIVGNEWSKNIDKETKNKFINKGLQDKERYKQEMKVYKQINGISGATTSVVNAPTVSNASSGTGNSVNISMNGINIDETSSIIATNAVQLAGVVTGPSSNKKSKSKSHRPQPLSQVPSQQQHPQQQQSKSLNDMKMEVDTLGTHQHQSHHLPHHHQQAFMSIKSGIVPSGLTVNKESLSSTPIKNIIASEHQQNMLKQQQQQQQHQQHQQQQQHLQQIQQPPPQNSLSSDLTFLFGDSASTGASSTGLANSAASINADYFNVDAMHARILERSLQFTNELKYMKLKQNSLKMENRKCNQTIKTLKQESDRKQTVLQELTRNNSTLRDKLAVFKRLVQLCSPSTVSSSSSPPGVSNASSGSSIAAVSNSSSSNTSSSNNTSASSSVPSQLLYSNNSNPNSASFINSLIFLNNPSTASTAAANNGVGLDSTNIYNQQIQLHLQQQQQHQQQQQQQQAQNIYNQQSSQQQQQQQQQQQFHYMNQQQQAQGQHQQQQLLSSQGHLGLNLQQQQQHHIQQQMHLQQQQQQQQQQHHHHQQQQQQQQMHLQQMQQHQQHSHQQQIQQQQLQQPSSQYTNELFASINLNNYLLPSGSASSSNTASTNLPSTVSAALAVRQAAAMFSLDDAANLNLRQQVGGQQQQQNTAGGSSGISSSATSG